MNCSVPRFLRCLGVCAVLSAALLTACGDGERSPPKKDGPAPAADPVEVYRAWKASYHDRAMKDPLFRTLSAEVPK